MSFPSHWANAFSSQAAQSFRELSGRRNLFTLVLAHIFLGAALIYMAFSSIPTAGIFGDLLSCTRRPGTFSLRPNSLGGCALCFFSLLSAACFSLQGFLKIKERRSFSRRAFDDFSGRVCCSRDACIRDRVSCEKINALMFITACGVGRYLMCLWLFG